MRLRLHAVVLTLCLLASPVVVATQAGDGPPQTVGGASSNTLTFTVPINLTQLLPDVTKVRASCSVESVAITVNRPQGKGGPHAGMVFNRSQELPAANGQVVATATVVVSVAGVLEDPVGKPAGYICSIEGYSNSQQMWRVFNSCNANGSYECTPVAFRITPFNFQLNNSGQFTW
jgi:hypothetical protein